MPLMMIDYPDAAWNKQQLSDHLACIGHQLQSPVFKRSTPFTRLSQVCWIELIRAVGDLVRQSLQAGKRIDFTEEVGTWGVAGYYQSARFYASVGLCISDGHRSSPAIGDYLTGY